MARTSGKKSTAKTARKKPASKRKPAARSKPRGKAKAAKAPAITVDAPLKNARSHKRRVRNVIQPKRSFRARWMRRLIIAAVVICLIPVLITLLYKPAAVHPVSTLMGYHWISGKPVKRIWVPLENISPFVVQSVVSSEDGKFCSHGGVDWDAINLIIDDLIEGERPRGASTLAMQSSKNLFLWNSRSYVRKGLEVPLALFTDMVWGKKRMMEIYLNIAEWGPGIFGIEAAAQHHFGRSAKSLTRKQAALLAVTLPNPILRNPRKPNRGMQRLARLVERRARASGAYVRCLR